MKVLYTLLVFFPALRSSRLARQFWIRCNWACPIRPLGTGMAGRRLDNSEPLRLSQLRGKVVLVDFGTCSCINCVPTVPYLNK
jgi:thiol-disulfide isomerase/thioredoxin